MKRGYQNSKPRGSANFRLGSNPQHEDKVMSKANISPTPIRSRRAVLAGIFAAAAVPIATAIPTAAPGMSSVPARAHADAKLLELWIEYERRLAVEEPLKEESTRLW